MTSILGEQSKKTPPQTELETLSPEVYNEIIATKVLIGIPCYNEERTIAKIVLQLKSISDQIIVCDDGSTDMTAEIAKALGCEVISHPRNLGKGAALRSLFLAARTYNPEVFVTFDGDGQHNALDISKLILPVLNNECDIAIGSRFVDKDSQSEMPSYRKLGSHMINYLVRHASNVPANDTQSGFRAYGHDAIMKITPGEYGMAVDTEILSQAMEKGFRIREFPTKIFYKGLKTSKHSPISQSLDVIASTIKFTSLRHPLMFYGSCSLVFLVVSLIFGLISLLHYSSVGALPFGPTVIGGAMFVVSMVLGAVAILLYAITTVVRQDW